MARVNVYLPDDLADLAKEHSFNISALTQRAIREEAHRMSTVTAAPKVTEWLRSVSALVVDTQPHESAPDVETEFMGTWVLDPEDDHRSGEGNEDAGIQWGFAVTAKGRFAVYSRHVNRGGGLLRDFDTMDEALDTLPEDLADGVRGQLTGRRVLDI